MTYIPAIVNILCSMYCIYALFGGLSSLNIFKDSYPKEKKIIKVIVYLVLMFIILNIGFFTLVTLITT